MPTTPNGTVYTSTSYTTSAGEPGIYVVGNAAKLAASVPLALVCHGNPGSDPASADGQFSNGSGYAALRNWLIDNGWAFAECRGAGANWGNAAGRAAYRALFDDVSALMSVGPVVVVGRSMGGLVGAYLASREPAIAPKCIGFVCLSGTLDLANRYAIATGTDLANLNAAYGVTNSTEFAAISDEYDPMKVATSVWSGRKAIQQYATGDGTVPPNTNAIVWRDKYGAQLTVNSVQITDGGDHNSSTGQDAAQSAATIAFLDAIWDPAVDASRRVVSAVKILRDGVLTPVIGVYVMDNGIRKQVPLSTIRAVL
ncbi:MULTISPECIES: alpha/beta fold hydrolase [unclassified Rhodococcus (in: high G+C Gram-positive bacteria)]|uniref:alpha/beta fold hydrolase n=1 Tax=unclassified Rhodococcus (in: high G+C Gram-positive bacteria) TaxID=192944 RepID=UPI000B9AAF87|nr:MULTISPECIES: alpha/beta hydrolase [unclassified Rhodococcus (in: high G+C Gram-positive bacteria)]OZE35586.1 hypothetical protein CH259_16285 [Rhodococcus sp. 05-2254-4]OZE48015.1 hypothetical protein CH261_08880 [Rhodococcus sp. 05-2254-3]OZE49226.1 hypothetical protein CH283_16665 [Rhodococcus sp. 05-2254-2]